MDILEITLNVGRTFQSQRQNPFAKNPLANQIRTACPVLFRSAVPAVAQVDILASASAGQGGWNASPFMSFLNKTVTTSSRSGYYPVILFERGFKSFCLVMAQGAEVLENTFGQKEALRVLTSRVPKLQAAAGDWKNKGFSTGPFSTYRSGDNGSEAPTTDPWASSIAFGKRYSLQDLPSLAEFVLDLESMISIYGKIVNLCGNEFQKQDLVAKQLLETGELPEGAGELCSGHDGAMKIAFHKRIESRNRNTNLVKKIKATLGYRCQGCGVSLALAYGKVGEKFIEAHHLSPLATMPSEGAQLEAKDFAVLCPTCHRVIHRLGCPDLIELKKSIHKELRNFHELLAIEPIRAVSEKPVKIRVFKKLTGTA